MLEESRQSHHMIRLSRLGGWRPHSCCRKRIRRSHARSSPESLVAKWLTLSECLLRGINPSPTAASRRVDWNSDAMPPFAAAHGWTADSFSVLHPSLNLSLNLRPKSKRHRCNPQCCENQRPCDKGAKVILARLVVAGKRP